MNLYLKENKAVRNIKKLIWLYFFLLIIEGALRKWVLPGLATPILIIRDPVAISIIFFVVYHKLWKPNIYIVVMWLMTAIGVCTALSFGHGNLMVSLYGARIALFHFPLIFIIGSIFDKNDVLQLGRYMLWLTIFMTVLVAMQFYSPQSAWVNRAIGGDVSGSGFSGAEGFYRVPGTFSFTNGLSYFYNLATCFIFFFLLNYKKIKINKMLMLTSALALVAAVPLTISRTVFFQIVLTVLFILVISFQNKKIMLKVFFGIIAFSILYVGLSNFTFFETATSAFTNRFENANRVEGGAKGVFIDRFFGGMFEAVNKGSDSFFGEGLGIGTQAGAKLATGKAGFLISEGEWGRIIGEQGILLGLIIIFIRILLCFKLLRSSWKELANQNILPWILISFGFIIILQGQWAQPTTLGFAILTGGLIMASFNDSRAE